MKSQCLAFITLFALGLLVNAGVVHIDVSRDGDVAVDIDTEQKPVSRRRQWWSHEPVYSPRQTAHVLEEYQVDLDYEIHQGYLSESGKFLNFSNIPYAEAPLKDLRWLEPIPPQERSETVNNGSVSHICPQFQVGWVSNAFEFLTNYGSKEALDSKWENRSTAEDYGTMPEQDKRANEDCLTLDVMVPKSVWESRNGRGLKAAVVVWIYGGGFIFGWKDQYGSPEGFFNAAEQGDEQNVIYVAMNYRLGAFGWLGGEKFQDQGGKPNVGLLDQKFALDWVRDNIYLFGGDSSRVTVMGQSAGASSIMHHVTAYGGRQQRPSFDKAIIQSPGFFPQPNNTINDLTYTKFLELTGASDLDALFEVDTKILMKANAEMTFNSIYGQFGFGPTVDGFYVPALPGQLLSSGRYHQGFPLLLGYTKYDGLLFTPPWIRSKQGLRDFVSELYPKVPEDVLATIDEKYKLHPGLGPKIVIGEVSDFLDDIAIQCNVHYLTEATLSSRSRLYHPVFKYVFNSLPAIHGYDTGYTYYPSKPLIEPVDETLAKFFQSTIVNFIRYVDPNPEDSEIWDVYTSDTRKVMNFGNPLQLKPEYSYKSGNDVLNREKCDYWASAPYYLETAMKGAEFVNQNDAYKEYL